MRPTVAEIRLRSLLANYRVLEENVCRSAGPGLRESPALLAVIKANAYGHGLELCGRALAAEGARWLGVTSVEEATALQGACHDLSMPRVLVMSGFFAGEEDAVLQHGLTAQVWAPWHFQLLETAAWRVGVTAQTVPVHLEIDTGMSRQGVAPGAPLATLLEGLGRDSPIWIEGVLTHFSSPEMLHDNMEPGPVMSAQLERFAEALAQLREAGVQPRWVHAGNSANAMAGVGLQALAKLALTTGASLLVRPGLALYGVPTRFNHPIVHGLVPVLAWKTRVTSLREVRPGTAVGYNETFVAQQAMRLALLPIGYADGLRRELSGCGTVLVRGQKAPVIGRVSMDQTVVDVTSMSGVEIGDEVVLLGSQGSEVISAWDMADLCKTIPYEVLCGIAARVLRTSIDS